MAALLERPTSPSGGACPRKKMPVARQRLLRARRIAGQVGTWVAPAVVVEFLVVPFLLPIPVGGVSYLLLQRPRRRTPHPVNPPTHTSEALHDHDTHP